jgi:hypothetical protein
MGRQRKAELPPLYNAKPLFPNYPVPRNLEKQKAPTRDNLRKQEQVDVMPIILNQNLRVGLGRMGLDLMSLLSLTPMRLTRLTLMR